jgi:hypothetical protein
MFARRAVLFVLLLSGCSGTNSPSATPSQEGARLASKVGQEVTLRGRFDGPGKLADYVIADGEQVYLKGISPPDANSMEYGTEVIVRGKLQHYVPLKADSEPTDSDEQPRAGLPEHYFIQAAKLERVP